MPSSTAAPLPQAEPPRPAPKGFATIGKAVTIKGEIYSEEDLYIDGEVEGTLELVNSRLTVGPSGRAKSNIRAHEVVVLGTIRGNVEAKLKITVHKDGNLVGDIKTSGIVIEDDAYFKGSIDIVKEPKAI
ncbi:MAG TPA: polymer-forming cytoskeletal protein [Bryobacteraceae bacterium]|nr:polymer-forming cytoskeletal protein [Bryobacteraceae bacterium]